MASKNYEELAQIMSLTPMTQGTPFKKACAAGLFDGYPVAIAWGARQKQASLMILVRFKKGSLKVAPALLAERLATSAPILAAMEKKKLGGAERKAIAAATDGILFHWDYSFRPPKPEQAAALVRALIGAIKEIASPIEAACEVCGTTSMAELCSVNHTLLNVCSGCRQRMGEEDRRALEEYEGRPSNPLLGTAAGLGAAVGTALLWGGVAYSMHRIFLWGGILIGLAIAWSVNKGMGKVNLYGRGLTVVLTVAAVMGGDFFFMWLSAADELNESVTLDLASRLAPHFLAIEFSDSSGWLSLLFGVLGAVFILYANRPPSIKRDFVPIGRATA